MQYEKIVEGIFLNRPNRFISHVLINGKKETVHVKNTGRCRELLIPGVKVILEDCSSNPNRKTKYSLISVWKNDMLINMDSQVPNFVVYNALRENSIDGLTNLTYIKREVSFNNSRFDIYFEDEVKKGFIEVKGVTLENDGISMFPDAPTERGTKHALEMIEAVKQGYRGIIFFLIQMKGPKVFRLNWKMDNKFSEAVRLASEKGVEILAYDSIIDKNSISIGSPIDIELDK
ncbi:DNA/RNA nuclease SfsA [Paratissierella segnis]|uniref:Sugar fermentation stimulation protein homolog n=1 Tax=Paratissierella segnis TaxID=2763679 RepID=A0A926IJQ3_9FIRM|nr:DNA/RNA nuclease SfsA [Paratissierella segnis]MBC8586903.1 DNA/RNA nuclease SfsA [Paratissierella segnis]